MNAILSGYGSLAADPMALTGVVLLFVAILWGGYGLLLKTH